MASVPHLPAFWQRLLSGIAFIGCKIDAQIVNAKERGLWLVDGCFLTTQRTTTKTQSLRFRMIRCLLTRFQSMTSFRHVWRCLLPRLIVLEQPGDEATKLLARLWKVSGLEGAELAIKMHPHMLRHACGYALANKGHDTRAIHGWLGHRSITSTGLRVSGAPSARDA
jgi:Phage integrase family